jgi:hypothetical protein
MIWINVRRARSERWPSSRKAPKQPAVRRLHAMRQMQTCQITLADCGDGNVSPPTAQRASLQEVEQSTTQAPSAPTWAGLTR